MPTTLSVPAGAEGVPSGRGGRGCRRAVRPARLASREVSLAPGAREANSQAVDAEELPSWGESGGILSAGTRLALFGAGLLSCSSAKLGKGQALPRDLPVLVWREREKENTSSERHLTLFCLLLRWPGLGEGLSTAGAVRAPSGLGSPRC